MSAPNHAVTFDNSKGWHIVGAGRIGSLAAAYVLRAAVQVTAIRAELAHVSR